MFYIWMAILIYALPFLILRPSDVFQPEFLINAYFITLVGLGPITLMTFFPTIAMGGYTRLFWIVAVGYLSINVGFLMSRAMSGRPDLSRLMLPYIRTKRLRAMGLLLVVVSLVAGCAFFARAGGVPLLSESKELARVAALGVSGNGYFLYLMTLGAYGVLLLFAAKFVMPRPSLDTTMVIAIICFVIVAAFLTGTGSRRYVIWMLLYVVMARHYLVKQLSVTKSLILGVALLAFVSLFELVRNPDSETTASFAIAVMYRSVIYTSNLEKVFAAFSAIDGAMGGKTLLMDIATILPGKQVDYQSWLKEVVGIEFEGFGIPPTLMGDMYVNFRYGGVVIGCVAFGFVVRSMYSFLLARLNPFLGVFVYIVMIEYMTKIVTSGLSAQSIGLIWGAMVCAMVALAGGLVRVRAR